MAGYSGLQSTSDLPEYASLDQSKKDALNTLTKAQDSSSAQKESHVTEQMAKVTNLEKKLNEELKQNLVTWTFIMPANINAISASAPKTPKPQNPKTPELVKIIVFSVNIISKSNMT